MSWTSTGETVVAEDRGASASEAQEGQAVQEGPRGPTESVARHGGAAGRPVDLDPGEDSARRLQARPYESDFAALPADELEGTWQRPGPVGSGIDRTSWPLVTIALGYLVMLLATFFRSFLLLGLGVLVFLMGVIWNIVNRRRAKRSGPGAPRVA